MPGNPSQTAPHSYSATPMSHPQGHTPWGHRGGTAAAVEAADRQIWGQSVQASGLLPKCHEGPFLRSSGERSWLWWGLRHVGPKQRAACIHRRRACRARQSSGGRCGCPCPRQGPTAPGGPQPPSLQGLIQSGAPGAPGSGTPWGCTAAGPSLPLDAGRRAPPPASCPPQPPLCQ